MSKQESDILGTYFVLIFNDTTPITYEGIVPLFNDEFAAKAYLKKMERLLPHGGYQVKRIELKNDDTYKTILRVTLFDPFEDGVAWGEGDRASQELCSPSSKTC